MSRRTSSAFGPKMFSSMPAKRDRQPRFGLRNGDAGLQPADNAKPRGAGTVQKIAAWNDLPHIVSGTHKSGDAPTSSPKNPAGATPTTVMGTPLTRTIVR